MEEHTGLKKRRVIAVKTSVYSRVCGYYTPTETWNLGKKAEFGDRSTFSPEELSSQTKELSDQPPAGIPAQNASRLILLPELFESGPLASPHSIGQSLPVLPQEA